MTEPSKILDRLNLVVEETFGHHGKDVEDIKDGMDISLCSLEYKDENNATLQWAGANNPVWIFKGKSPEGIVEFLEHKADKQPIGAYLNRKPFTNHSIDLSKGDTIYIFTDGYADQFGGEKGKKFKYTSMRDLFLSMNDLPMKQQKEKLNEVIDGWMHNSFEQIDDMCIIGVKI